MQPIHLMPFFMIGLLGSVHCVGMCGGIVSALTISSSPPILKQDKTMTRTWLQTLWPTLLYNLGRITSYAIAGALMGGLASNIASFTSLYAWQKIAAYLIHFMIMLLGLYLMNVVRFLDTIAACGNLIWRHIQPYTRHILPLNHPFKLFVAGSIWGWLPCSMVYSVLLTALLSSHAISGAAIMVAFGLGTLPMLLTVGLLGARLRHVLQRRTVQLLSGATVFLLGVWGWLRLMSPPWFDALCSSIQ